MGMSFISICNTYIHIDLCSIYYMPACTSSICNIHIDIGTLNINKTKYTGSEIVWPLWHTVSLVDADESDRRQRLKHPTKQASPSGNRFRRQEQEVQFAGFDFFYNFLSSSLRLIEMQASSTNERRKSGDLKLNAVDYGTQILDIC